mmetsp:Transcript_27574/g.63913  ORF Transcript_27574/g.63913 Transcript_27574/m.63913 type:complete len:255 (+) Transcript_27574:589-1353(+)
MTFCAKRCNHRCRLFCHASHWSVANRWNSTWKETTTRSVHPFIPFCVESTHLPRRNEITYSWVPHVNTMHHHCLPSRYMKNYRMMNFPMPFLIYGNMSRAWIASRVGYGSRHNGEILGVSPLWDKSCEQTMTLTVPPPLLGSSRVSVVVVYFIMESTETYFPMPSWQVMEMNPCLSNILILRGGRRNKKGNRMCETRPETTAPLPARKPALESREWNHIPGCLSLAFPPSFLGPCCKEVSPQNRVHPTPKSSFF